MAAITPIVKEAAGALPGSIILCGAMNVIFALEPSFKAGELDAFWLFRITFSFCNFADHT
jgi:hypothetical protein